MAFLIKITAFLFFITLFGFPSLNQAEEVDEYRLKAALVINFGRYTQWPESTFQTDSLFNLCVMTDNDTVFEHFLALSQKKIHKHSIDIHRIDTADDLQETCHLLFVAKGIKRSNFPKIFLSLTDQAILIIGEVESFISSGGIIRIDKADNKISFQVSVKNAKQHHLHISPLLLRHATAIHE